MGTKFTPGPWSVSNLTDVFTELSAKNAHGISADNNDAWQVADCLIGKTYVDDELVELELDEQIANANLIAAAPDLYEALEDVVRISDRDHAAWLRAKIALAKARGESC